MANFRSFQSPILSPLPLLELLSVSDTPSLPEKPNTGTDTEPVILMLEGVLQAPSRCQITSSYIQAVVTPQRIFLTSNLNARREIRITSASTRWTIGRTETCAIAIPDPSISRCHAVIHYDAGRGFSITDEGSKNGTRVNFRRLPENVSVRLRDGDLMRLGRLEIEFFILSSQGLERSPNADVKDLEDSLSIH